MHSAITKHATSDVSQEVASPTAALLESGYASSYRVGVAAATHREARRAPGGRTETEEAR